MQKECVITGSFDPFTIGHKDLVDKALQYFDVVNILVAANPEKKHMFSYMDRHAIIKDIFNQSCYKDRVVITDWGKLTVDWCSKSSCHTIVRGIRDTNDMSYELNMANINHMLGKEHYNIDIETIFFPAHMDYTHISSSFIRAIIGDNPLWKKYVVNPDYIESIFNNHIRGIRSN